MKALYYLDVRDIKIRLSAVDCKEHATASRLQLSNVHLILPTRLAQNFSFAFGKSNTQK